jgi:hypothetical protein
MPGIEQRFTRQEFTDALRAEAARLNVRMDERTLCQFTDSVFMSTHGMPCHTLITHTFPTLRAAFIDELRYNARMNRISAAMWRRPLAGKS